jgi:hypothetical protein
LADASLDWAPVGFEPLAAIALRCMDEAVAARHSAEAAAAALQALLPSDAGLAVVLPAMTHDGASSKHISSSFRLAGSCAGEVYLHFAAPKPTPPAPPPPPIVFRAAPAAVLPKRARLSCLAVFTSHACVRLAVCSWCLYCVFAGKLAGLPLGAALNLLWLAAVRVTRRAKHF